MPSVTQVYEELCRLAPPELAQSWDNSGLLVNMGGEVTGVLCALDITPAVVREAQQLGCNLTVSHHPVIFAPLKSLSAGDVPALLVQSGISAICMHTNLDAAAGGVNDVLAEKIGLQNVCEFAQLGRIGTLSSPVSAREFAAMCAQRLGASVRLADAGKPVQRVALVGGSGGDMAVQAAAEGADILLTGDASHHHALDALAAGISLAAAGHYCTEAPVVPVLAQRLSQAFSGLRVLISQQGGPFITL